MMRHYEPVIGALWGADLATFDRRLMCLCKEFVMVVRASEPFTWALQHGDNPEHRSPWYDTGDLMRAQEWLESIHLRRAVAKTG
jgi:hypothetical protein